MTNISRINKGQLAEAIEALRNAEEAVMNLQGVLYDTKEELDQHREDLDDVLEFENAQELVDSVFQGLPDQHELDSLRDSLTDLIDEINKEEDAQ